MIASNAWCSQWQLKLGFSVLAMFAAAAHAQVAAEESLRLVASLPSPWGKPLTPAWPNGTTLKLTTQAMEGPKPLVCAGEYVFMRSTPGDLFEGNLPAPADRSAQALGMPAELITQRVTCPNGSFDLHRAADGRAWLSLDNVVMQWDRAKISATPEATVQALLVRHLAGTPALSRESLAAHRAWLTDALFERFDRWLVRIANSDEAPYLNGDPLTDSQETPQSFQLAPANIQGERAQVVVSYDGEAIEPYAVRFDLIRRNGTWRVDDLYYRGGERLSDLLEPAFAIAGGFGFDWHDPESARCTRVTETQAQAFSACDFHESGAFGLPIAYHACKTRSGGEFLVFKTAALCQQAIETMEANAP